ncbi:MAG: alpha/beta fold hydrolase [Microthrixaceae bacterium]|nr:alpha/beta fold hydrolase [Myxococcales bacterium]MCB1013239.1 alpha/beta fold hydrolase [Microthrixaceae bacterium]
MQTLPPPALPDWLSAQLPFERYCVRVGPHWMHLMEAGEGRPVLMLHGNPTWGYLYRKVAAALRGEPLRLVMPDLIGLGLSDKPHDLGVHQLAAHSQWIGTLIDHLDLDGAIFVGQDWGGPIGLHAFSQRRERLAGMVVLNTVVGPPRPGFRPTAFHRFGRLPVVSDLAFRVVGFPQIALDRAQGDRESIRGEVARAYRYPLRRISDRVAPLALTRMVPDGPTHPSIPALEECAALAGSFEGPVRMVWGKRDPVLGRALKRTRSLLGDPPVVETDAGHFLQEEVPEVIADAIREVAADLH